MGSVCSLGTAGERRSLRAGDSFIAEPKVEVQHTSADRDIEPGRSTRTQDSIPVPAGQVQDAYWAEVSVTSMGYMR